MQADTSDKTRVHKYTGESKLRENSTSTELISCRRVLTILRLLSAGYSALSVDRSRCIDCFI